MDRRAVFKATSRTILGSLRSTKILLAFAAHCASVSLLVLHQTAAQAAWDLRHSWAIEEFLRDYVRTLPQGSSIAPPRLILYTGTAYTRACPDAGIEAPAYCWGDHTIYLEMKLGNEQAAKFGDFGALSIIAHEFGHAYLAKLGRHPEGKAGELAADRFAGGFARYLNLKGLLEAGDIDEARATFADLGDYAVNKADHHGTPAERRAAFEDGYLIGFRAPGDHGTSQPQAPPQPPAEQPQPQAPGQPSTEQPQPLPPSAPPQALSIIGLGLAALLSIAILAGVISLVSRARDDDP